MDGCRTSIRRVATPPRSTRFANGRLEWGATSPTSAGTCSDSPTWTPTAPPPEQEGRDTVKSIEAGGGRAVFHATDVADPDSTEAMAATAASDLGGIDILVNNAAMFASLQGGAFTDISVDRWDRTMAVNVKGA